MAVNVFRIHTITALKPPSMLDTGYQGAICRLCSQHAREGVGFTFNTPVSDENIRRVSGGEKKSVSIAEVMSMYVRLACWDK